jgi:hypothetical protein
MTKRIVEENISLSFYLRKKKKKRKKEKKEKKGKKEKKEKY